jgi:hypothetical protein
MRARQGLCTSQMLNMTAIGSDVPQENCTQFCTPWSHQDTSVETGAVSCSAGIRRGIQWRLGTSIDRRMCLKLNQCCTGLHNCSLHVPAAVQCQAAAPRTPRACSQKPDILLLRVLRYVPSLPANIAKPVPNTTVPGRRSLLPVCSDQLRQQTNSH